MRIEDDNDAEDEDEDGEGREMDEDGEGSEGRGDGMRIGCRWISLWSGKLLFIVSIFAWCMYSFSFQSFAHIFLPALEFTF